MQALGPLVLEQAQSLYSSFAIAKVEALSTLELGLLSFQGSVLGSS